MTLARHTDLPSLVRADVDRNSLSVKREMSSLWFQIDWSSMPPEMLVKIFWLIRDLNRLFRVCKSFYGAAYLTLTRRLILEDDNPMRERYIELISLREYADDWQLRIQKNCVLAEIEQRKDHESSDYEEWLLYVEDNEATDEIEWCNDDD